MTITSPFKSGVLEFDREAVLRDYRIGTRSRHASVIGRQEVLTGRGKFGIFGDGKEVAQLALAYAFRKGDFRSGYYRDQTFMMALGLLSVQQLFAQLYAHADLEAEPGFGGRSMTGHFVTRLLDAEGRWLNQSERYNSAADLSPTAAQMPRTVGLAYASKLYRNLPALAPLAEGFSRNGDEVVFATIGNASCAEGLFWEAVNALGVVQAPAVISIWDDGYGISVPNRFQMTKNDVSAALRGFARDPGGEGFDLYRVEGWNYAALCETYLRAAAACRREHVPAVVHVTELTQPQGHSTSGSHERYKSPERLEWEREFDCLRQMREWILAEGLASREELEEIEEEERSGVLLARDRAWEAYRAWIEVEARELDTLLERVAVAESGAVAERVRDLARSVGRRPHVLRRDLLATSQAALAATLGSDHQARRRLGEWYRERVRDGERRYGSHLVSETRAAAMGVPVVPPRYSEGAGELNAFEILNAGFDAAFARYPQLVAMGEDIGQLGDVNQGFAHLQEKYGSLRIADTGIREATILGQAIGLALRGLRPIAEIQYLDSSLRGAPSRADVRRVVRKELRRHLAEKFPAAALDLPDPGEDRVLRAGIEELAEPLAIEDFDALLEKAAAAPVSAKPAEAKKKAAPTSPEPGKEKKPAEKKAPQKKAPQKRPPEKKPAPTQGPVVLSPVGPGRGPVR